MKKKLIILPVLAALFTACTNDELVVDENKVQRTEEEGAITFDAYLNRAVTRAGKPGILKTSTSSATEASLQNEGFGVFAYYTDGGIYTENAIPNFMYNQQVNYNTTTTYWEYTPIKYWPNEFGSSAVSMGVDRVTFFAYAPYVGVEPSTGLLTGYYDDTDVSLSTETGITALTRNGKAGDPYVRYVGAFDPANCVDLCYGVAAGAYTSSVGALDGANSIEAGKPYINVAKPQVNGKLDFNFKHALAKLNVQVDADVDILAHATLPNLNNNTRVWVRAITFDGIAQRGYLNLNNGVWYDAIDNNRISHGSVTIHDGRHDGAEALADDSYEIPIGLNPALVQSGAYTTTPGTTTNGAPKYEIGDDFSTTSGVTATPQPLFGEASHDLLVIPSNEPLRVTIVYDVETADATLPKFLSDGVTRGSTVENKITKSITVSGNPLKLEAGNAYTVKLHLGMTSVKFEAEVSGWQEPVVDADGTWLPENCPVVTASASPYNTASATVPADATSFTFKVKGLKASETVNNTYTNVTGDASGTSTTEGTYMATVTLTDNTETTKKTGTAQVVGSTSTKGAIFTIIQAPHALGLGAYNSTPNDLTPVGDLYTLTDNVYVFKLSSGATGHTDWSSDEVKVYDGGTELTGGVNYSLDTTTGEINLSTYMSSIGGGSKTFTIKVKSGDALEETIKVKVTKVVSP